MRDLYRQEILDHYKNPHNFGDLKDADLIYEEFNPLCGDRVKLQLKTDLAKNWPEARVVEVKFSGEGCAISTAAASIFTDYLKGKKIARLRKLAGEDILKVVEMEDISPGRLKCALLPWEALRKALPS